MLESHRQPTVYVDSNYDLHARNKSERRPEKIEEGCGRRIANGMTYGVERFGQAPGDACQRGSGMWVAIAFKTGFCFNFGAEIIFIVRLIYMAVAMRWLPQSIRCFWLQKMNVDEGRRGKSLATNVA